MARRRHPDGSDRRILESWDAPEDAGEPVGCLATTYTFKPDFFEEHCLSRFLRLDTDPREGGAAYLLEREAKLAEVTVCALVDRSQADGAASPRWAVLPISVPTGIQHAKVSLLCWARRVRLIVGSANLTDSGYRQNQEIFGVLDYHEHAEAPQDALRETLAFLEALLDWAPGDPAERGPKARALSLIRGTRARLADWPPAATSRPEVRVQPLFVGPRDPYREPIPRRLGQVVRERGGPAHSAWVLSPFFDTGSDGPYPGTMATLDALTDRGDRTIEFGVPGETLPDGRLRLGAPRSLIQPGKKRATFTVWPISELVDRETRPLHAKGLWLWNDRWHAYMIGSSNFTTAGLGLESGRTNVEANLVYLAPEDSSAPRAFDDSVPPCGEAVADPDEAIWEPVDEQQEDGAGSAVPLHPGFREALFVPRGEKGTLRLMFAETLPPAWIIVAPALGAQASIAMCRAEDWEAKGRPRQLELAWSHRSVPTRLDVTWSTASGDERKASWPVNVTDPSALLPPDELRHLPLDTLIEVLVSTAPLHEAIARATGRGTRRTGDGEEAPELDPHQRVQTETFLLQRTKRVAGAIERLVERLRRPAFTEDAIQWRFHGPLGPRELARAIRQEARSAGEVCFLLTEILLALATLDPGAIAAGVSQESVVRGLGAVRNDLRAAIRESLEDDTLPASLAGYVSRVLDEVPS